MENRGRPEKSWISTEIAEPPPANGPRYTGTMVYWTKEGVKKTCGYTIEGAERMKKFSKRYHMQKLRNQVRSLPEFDHWD